MRRTRLFVSLASFILLSLLTLTGFGCQRNNQNIARPTKPLVVWGLWQDSSMMDPVIEAFESATGIKVEYKKIASVADYENQLLEALAEHRGPDIFVIHHTWVEKRRGIMYPAPAEIIDERALREEFVDVVAQDVVRDGQIYALPTSVDTLALYYNKDLLSAAGVARPPRTWTDMLQTVERITTVSRVGTVVQSGIALGTGANVNRVGDIIQTLMLQSGVVLDPGSEGTAALTSEAGQRAVTFYTDFANKAKKVYTWDLQQDYSLDAFAEGDTAMMINYSYHIPTIKAKNPRLSFGIAPLPQNADSKVVNFAAYWPFAVSNTSESPVAAWQFLRFMTNADMSQAINQAQGAPPARRDSVVQLSRDPLLGIFAEQSLSAVSWPRRDIAAIDVIFSEMVDSIVTGTATTAEAVQRAQDRVNQLYQTNEAS